MVSSELVELGREAANRIAAEIRMGASLVHCQLLASQFYDALRVQCGDGPEDRASAMAAALRRCARASEADISPQRMLAELHSAVVTLEEDGQSLPPGKAGRPVLRVIQGGRAP